MKIGKNCKIHETSYIDDDVDIGESTKIWHFCNIIGGTSIGKNCSFGQNVVVGPNVRIGNNVKVQNNVSIYEGVEIEDNVFCGPSCVFTNVINPRSEIVRKNEFKKTMIRSGVTIGANSTIVCGYELGRYSFIAAGATVTSNVPEFALFAGTPAKQIGWVSRSGEKLGNDLICKSTGLQYKLINENKLIELNDEK